jgi:outer membrane receptor protein involved in Fe transport
MKRRAIYPPRLLFIFSFLLLSVLTSFAQNAISGRIVDEKATPIAGATVTIKNGKASTRTDENGVFRFNNITGSNVLLVITHVSYERKEVTFSPGVEMNITLNEKATAADEVVVTGVFDKRKKMEASVAISTVSSKEIAKIAPVSAADLLKNVPGVYVNSSLGEIRNTVYSRGVSVGSNSGANGYYYVSMQEDGLPVANATYSNWGPDYFLRADATLGRLEAVRGGTASILGANAPGGIFNYVMKEGGEKTTGEVRSKFGLQGDGKNSYYRADFNIGGPLGRSWYYDVGGFYRYDEGARYPGYALNRGGQFRGNVVKKYATGSLKLYAKYLNDHNASFEFTPTVGFDNPRPAEGFSQTSSVLIPSLRQNFLSTHTGRVRTFDSKDAIHSMDKAIGATWEQRLGNGWIFNNAARYSDKSMNLNTTGVVYPIDMSDLISYAVLGQLGMPGTYNFRNANTGQQLLTVKSFSGYDFNVLQNALPGAAISPNSLFFEPLFYMDNKSKELLDQFSLTKRLKNMSFTLGGFYGHSKIDKFGLGAVGVALGTIQDRPELVNINRTNPDGSITQITTPNGAYSISGGLSQYYATQNQTAFFFGHNWQMTPDLNLDWGVRYERVRMKGSNMPVETKQSTTGGLDGNPLTLYDNNVNSFTGTFPYDKTVPTFSYSVGVNYKINNNFAVYGRVSEGNKAPDLDMYMAASNDFLAKTLNPVAQTVRQIEAGVKVKTGALNLFVTPFYSVLSNVAEVQAFQDKNQNLYNTPAVFNKYRTIGVETEADYSFAQYFHVRGVLTVQRSKAVDYSTWLARSLGSQDDTLITFSGNETDNIARSIINITPSYNRDKFFAQLTWSYMGKRQANVANAFLLPAFSQFNFSAGYDVSKHVNFQFVVNNIFNKYGVMSWSRPGAFLEAIDRQGFTKQMYQDAVNRNRPYSTVSIPARAYFITGTFKF